MEGRSEVYAIVTCEKTFLQLLSLEERSLNDVPDKDFIENSVWKTTWQLYRSEKHCNKADFIVDIL